MVKMCLQVGAVFCHYFRLTCQLSVGMTMAHASGGPKSRTTRSGKRFRANAPLHGQKAKSESSRLSKRRKAEQRRANESTPKRRTRADAQQEVLLAMPESDRAAEVADTHGHGATDAKLEEEPIVDSLCSRN
jgi:hypothetical protein